MEKDNPHHSSQTNHLRVLNKRVSRTLIGLLGLALLAIFVIRLPFTINTGDEKVNILVIMVDDLDQASFDQLLSAKLLPNIERHIVNRGVTFEQSYVTNSACCPSRASFLTGQYAHNHGVNSTAGDHGGMQGFHPAGDMARPSLAIWLKDEAGETQDSTYYTGLIGKYMNRYIPDDETGTFSVPLGWDVWRVLNAAGTHQLEPGKYQIIDNQGRAEAKPFYQTRFIGDEALRFLGDEAASSAISYKQSEYDAFFLYLTPTAPHVVALPEDPTHYGTCSETHPQWKERVVPDSAAMNGFEEQDYRFPEMPSCDQQFPDGCLRRDGPGGILPLEGLDIPGIDRLGSKEVFLKVYDQGVQGQQNETLRPAWIDFHWDSLECNSNFDFLRRQHLDRLESMLSVDVMVGKVISELESQEMLDDTLVIFTSDNGFMLGEHRLGNKQVSYEEAIRVPLIIRPPHSTTGDRVNTNLVANIDLAPTILDYAGRSWEDFDVDGRSLRPLLEGPGTANWRDWLLIEHWHPDGHEENLTNPDGWYYVPTHISLRTAADFADWPDLTLVEYEDSDWGEHDSKWIDYFGKPGYSGRFLYDLHIDSSQVENVIDSQNYSEIVPVLSEALHALTACKKETCRTADKAMYSPSE